MAQSEIRTYTPEETLALLDAKAKATGEDAFWVRVVRRTGLALGDTVARLEHAALSHVARPEAWLPTLCGGGSYTLVVGHMTDDPTRHVGGPIPVQFKDDAKPVDPLVIGMPGWAGPKTLVYPDPNLAAARPYSPHGRPAGASPRNDAPYLDGSWGGFGGTREDRYGRDAVDMLKKELEQERKRAEDRERSWREQTDKGAAEARERDRAAKFEAELRDLRTMLADAQQQATLAAQTKPAPTDYAALITAMAPVLTAMIDGQNTLRAEQIRTQAALAGEQRLMMEKITARPAIDPTVQAMLDKMERTIEKAKEESGGASEMLDSMTQAMGTMTKIAMQSAQVVAETSLRRPGEEEPTGLKAFREGMKALENIFAAWGKVGGEKGAPNQRRQLPPKVNGAQEKQPPVAPATPDEVTQVVDAIRAERNPEEVAAVIVKLAHDENEAFVKAMNEVGRNLNELAVRRLGPDWILSHQSYLSALLKAVERLGAGVFGPGEGEGGREGEGEGEKSKGDTGKGEGEGEDTGAKEEGAQA